MGTKVLDLFCGAGGFTLGAQNAGYDVVAGVDYDEDAIATYEHNFNHRAIECDLAQTPPSEFADTYDITKDDVDVIIGGPPCQGFSIAGDRNVDDERNNLVFVFAEYVDYYEPEKFVMENVEGIASIDDGETIDLLYDDFNDAGYGIDHDVLNAADYGVPQTRKRAFFVGVKSSVSGSPTFPDSTYD